MRRRPAAFVCLALVAVGALLAFAPRASSQPRSLINQFIGPRLIRAEVLVLGPDGSAQDYRIDRGVIVAATAAGVLVRESNGDVVTVPAAAGTQVQGRRSGNAPQLRRGMRVVVYQLAGAPTQIVQGGSINGQLFGPRLIRAEVLLLATGSTTQDYRIDRGVVVSAGSGTLTLREANGDTVPVQVEPSAQLVGAGRKATVATLRRGVRVVVYRSANSAAQLVQVEGVGR